MAWLGTILNENMSVTLKLYMMYTLAMNAPLVADSAWVYWLMFPEVFQWNGFLAPLFFFIYPMLWITAVNHATFYNLWGVDISYWITKLTIFASPLSDRSLRTAIFWTWFTLPWY